MEPAGPSSAEKETMKASSAEQDLESGLGFDGTTTPPGSPKPPKTKSSPSVLARALSYGDAGRGVRAAPPKRIFGNASRYSDNTRTKHFEAHSPLGHHRKLVNSNIERLGNLNCPLHYTPVAESTSTPWKFWTVERTGTMWLRARVLVLVSAWVL